MFGCLITLNDVLLEEIIRKYAYMAIKNNCFLDEDLSSYVLSLKYLKIISELEDFTHIH